MSHLSHVIKTLAVVLVASSLLGACGANHSQASSVAAAAAPEQVIAVDGTAAKAVVTAFAQAQLVVPDGESANLSVGGLACTERVLPVTPAQVDAECRLQADFLSQVPPSAVAKGTAAAIFKALQDAGAETFLPSGASSHFGGLDVKRLDCTVTNMPSGPRRFHCKITQSQR